MKHKCKKKIGWNEKSILVFKKNKQKIVLNKYRNQLAFKKKFSVITDASSKAMGAVLSLIDNKGQNKIIYAYRKRLYKAQPNYSVTDKKYLQW